MTMKNISGMIRLAVLLGLSLLVLANLPATAAGLGNTKQFAMEMKLTSYLDSDTGETMVAKYYVGKDRVRMNLNIEGMPDGAGSISFFNGDEITTYMLIPQMKRYMKSVGTFDDYMEEGPGLIFGSPNDSGHPCQTIASMTCEKIGTDTILGRSVDKYRMKDVEDGDPVEIMMWFDPELLFVLKSEDQEGSVETTWIEIGSQPDALFEVPSDYAELKY